MPVALAALIPFIEALISSAPAAVSAYSALKAMNAAGIEPTPDQWAKIIASVDSANASVQSA